MRRSKRCHRDPVAEAIHYISMSADRPELTAKYINSVKGRGVFSQSYFEKGDFLVEYRGDVIPFDESQRRKRIYHPALQVYLFEFKVNGKKYCIDAARDDNSFGRLVNDDHLNPNSQMKRITVKGKPHLCLFAIRQILPGEEITYNYGDMDWPWREKDDAVVVETPYQGEDSSTVNIAHATVAEFPQADLKDDAVAVETPYQGEDSSTVNIAHATVAEFPQADLKDEAGAVETPYQGEDSRTVHVAHTAVVEFPQADLKDDAVAVETPYQGEDSSTVNIAHATVAEFPQADLKDEAGAVETPYQGEDSRTVHVAHTAVVEFPQADLKDDAVAVETPYQGEDSSTVNIAHATVAEFPQAHLKDEAGAVETPYQGEDSRTVHVAHTAVVEFPQADLKDEAGAVETPYKGEDSRTVNVAHATVVEFPQTDLKDDAVAVETPYQGEDPSTVNIAHATVVEFPQADLKDDAVAVETPYQGEDSSTVNIAHATVAEFPQADLKDEAGAVETPYQGEDSRTVHVAHTAVVEFPQADLKDDAVAVETPYQGEDPSTVIIAHDTVVEFPQADLKDEAGAVETPYKGEDSRTVNVAHATMVEFPQADLKDDAVAVETPYQGEDSSTVNIAHATVAEFPQADLKDENGAVETPYQGEDSRTVHVAHTAVVEFPQADLKDDVVAGETPYQGEDSSTVIIAHAIAVEFPQTDLKDDAVAVETPYQGEDSSTDNIAHATVAEFPQADLKDEAGAVETPYQGEDPSTVNIAHATVVEFPQTDLKDDAVAVETPYQGEDPSTVNIAHATVIDFPQADLKVQQIQIQLKLVDYTSSEEETSDTDHAVCSSQIIEDELCQKSPAVEFFNVEDDSSTVSAAHPAVLELTQRDLQNTESQKSYDEDYVPKLRRTKSILMKNEIPPITDALFDTDDSCPDSEEEYVPKSSDESSESSSEVSICQSHTNKNRMSCSIGKESMTRDGGEGSKTQGINREGSTAHPLNKERSMAHDMNKQKSTPQDTEREDNGQVLVSAVNKKCGGLRLYDKRQHCLFCRKSFTKISKHLERKHHNEVEVARAVSHPKNSKERRLQLDYLRKKGNWVHNTEVMRTGKGSLVACKRPKEEANCDEFVHCSFCFGLFARKVLWRHVKTCSFKPADVKPRPGKNRVLSLCALTSAPAYVTADLWKVMSHMNQDRVSIAVRGDELIMEMGQHLYNRLGSDRSKHEQIRQKMRELGRLVISAREVTSLMSISDMITPSNFMQTVSAVKHLCGYDQQSDSYKIPTLPLKIGQSLAKISELLESKALVNGDEETAKAARNFRQVYYAKWNELVSASAYRTLEEGKWNTPLLLPLTEDVKKLHLYLDEKEKEYRDGLLLESSTTNWSKLAQVTLAKVILFNRRREGEVSKMRLSSFLQRDRSKPNDELNAALSELEQKLCKHFQRLEIRGKRGRKVPVLLTPDMVQSLELLVEKREECGVEKDNPYLFSRPCAMTYFRGSEYINHFAHACGAEHPENLSSTKLRKHIGTLSKVLNLSNTELDQLADFLGHDIRIHRQFYRLPEGTLQLAKISKVLMALETGRLCEFKGKSLEDINIDPDERVEDDGRSELDDESGEQVQGDGQSVLDDESEDQVEDGGHSALDDESEGDCPPKKQTRSASPLYTCSVSMKGSKGKVTETTLKTKRGTRSCKVRRPFMRKMWQPEEIHAVEKHMMNFIRTCRVPGKSDCDACLKSEPLHLKTRDWKAVKFYVKNRIDALKKKK